MPPRELPQRPAPGEDWAARRGDGFRYVVYLSYLPRRHATSGERARRREVFEAGRTTGHWAYPVRLNAEKIRFDTREYTVQPAALERVLEAGRVPLARRLIGYDA